MNTRKISLLLLMILAAFSMHAQTITVKGIVKDSDGQAIIGAAVIEKNAPSNGVITDLDGNFELQVPQGAILHVSRKIIFNRRVGYFSAAISSDDPIPFFF